MNLATRCHACGTAFRVVRDQLRVSEGWVRCGRCMAVFNATDDLFELDAEDASPADAPGETARRVLDELDADRRHWQAQVHAMPAAWTQTVRPAEGLHDEVPTRSAASAGEALAPAFEPVDAAAPGHEPPPNDIATPAPATIAIATATATEPAADDAGEAPAPSAEDEPDLDLPDTVPADDGRPAAIIAWTDAAPAAAAGVDAAAETVADAAPPLPSFVRRADRAAFWRSPRMRAVLGGGAVLLLLALLLQIGHAGRDLIAAHWPPLAPALQALCDVTGCRIAPLRRIDRLSVDSAGLTQLEDAALYRLQVVLHNRADTALLAPALDLSLEDSQGAVIARRVLRPAELGLASPVIAAGAQLPLTVTLAARDRRIAGYHVELFYP